MTGGTHRNGWVIVASFLAAIVLALLPMPDWAEPFRPDWPILVLLYWSLALPDRAGVGVGWLLGLTMDVLRGTLLGQHALAYALVAFIMVKLHQQVRVYPLRQQMLAVLLLLLLTDTFLMWVRGIAGQSTGGWSHWLTPLIGTLVWPWVFTLLRSVRQRLRVS